MAKVRYVLFWEWWYTLFCNSQSEHMLALTEVLIGEHGTGEISCGLWLCKVSRHLLPNDNWTYTFCTLNKKPRTIHEMEWKLLLVVLLRFYQMLRVSLLIWLTKVFQAKWNYSKSKSKQKNAISESHVKSSRRLRLWRPWWMVETCILTDNKPFLS